jgi:hypothetical protein
MLDEIGRQLGCDYRYAANVAIIEPLLDRRLARKPSRLGNVGALSNCQQHRNSL